MYHHSFHKLAPGLLSVSLLLCSCARLTPGSPTATIAASPTEPPTPTDIAPTAAPVTAQGKQPPACTFPLAQTTMTDEKPETYTFSEPKVVLTASSNIDIDEWLPDNRRVLITRDIPGKSQQSIELFDSRSGNTQVYAIRTITLDAPPVWMAKLNAVMYPAMNIISVDKIKHHTEITRQAWISQGDPNSVKMVTDNMAQFYIAVKPDGSQVTYQSSKQLSKLNASTASLPSLPSLSFDLTQWASADASFYAAWRPDTSQVFLYNTSYVPSIPGYTFLVNVDNGQICNIDLGSIAHQRAWAGVGRWSPDGRYVAVIRASGSLSIDYSDLAVLDTATGKLYTMDIALQEGQGGSHFVKDIAWAPDNRHLSVLAGSDPSGDEKRHSDLYLVDFISGQNIHLLPTYQFSVGWWGTNMSWSPDGSELLAACPSSAGEQLCLLNVQKNIQP